MNKDTPASDLTRRETFSHWTPVTIRFSDQDSLGHVNNVAIVAYVEACRTMLINKFLLQEHYPNLNYVLVHIDVDYRAEFHYPGTVEVGGRIERVGGKSFTSGYGLFVDDKCVATSRSVNVFFDTVKRESITPPQEVLDLLAGAI